MEIGRDAGKDGVKNNDLQKKDCDGRHSDFTVYYEKYQNPGGGGQFRQPFFQGRHASFPWFSTLAPVPIPGVGRDRD
jgi:hypothetical protein